MLSSNNEAYKEKMEAQLKIWNAKIEEFKAKAQKKNATVQIDINKKIDQFMQKKEESMNRIEEIKKSGDVSWDEIKTSMEKAFNDFKDNVEKQLEK